MSSTTSTAPSGTTTPGSRIITTTFSTAWATWTAVIDVEHSTTIAVYQDGSSIGQSTTSTPTNTRPNWPRPTSNQRPPGQAPSSLYLLTFAITLSLLLSISLAILLRNLVQRARERRIREAVAAGLIPPDSLTWIWRAQLGLSGLGRWGSGSGASTSAPRRVGPQPVLWDSWLAGDGAEKGYAARDEKAFTAWAGITPLSVSPLTSTPPLSASTTDAASTPPPPRRTFVEYIFHLPPMPHIPSSPPPPAPGTSSNVLAAEDDVAAQQERMIADLFRESSSTPSTAVGPSPGARIALYIAMPQDPRRAQTRGAEESGLADVDAVLGTSDVRWDASRPPLSATSGTASGSGSNVR